MSSPSPILETPRLKLVPFAPDHLSFLHDLWTEERVRRYLWDDRVIMRDEAAEVIAGSVDGFRRRGFGFWVLEERETGQSVGFAGLREFGEAGEVELLYGLLPAWWGQGLATEASTAVLRFAFDVGGLARVHAGTDPPNTASLRVMERLGMGFEGRRVIAGVEAVYYVLDAAVFRRFLASNE